MVVLACMAAAAAGGLRYEVLEGTLPGTAVGDVAADSAAVLSEYPAAVRSRLRFFFLLHDSPAQRFFTLDAVSGALVTSATVLDRDTLCPGRAACTLTLDAALRPAAYFRVINVAVEVVDRNDNVPRFPTDLVEISLSERARPGYFYLVEGATDADSPANGIGRYELRPPSAMFSLEARRGEGDAWDLRLALDRSLDRETTALHSLVLVAVDRGEPPRSGSVEIRVRVLDANDNSPVFDRPVYRVDVAEDADVGRTVVTVRATDRDAGDNARLRYALVDADADLFTVDAVTGAVTLQASLDYERRHTHRFGVMASDSGDDVLTATTIVHIDVVDVNDNKPRITVHGETVEIAEHSPPRTFVAHISVEDADAGANGAVTCQLSGGGATFSLIQLLETEFKLVSVSELDREARASYTVTVECRDGGVPGRSAVAQLDVTITDVNDHAPVFTPASYDVRLSENDGVGAYVVTVTASDADCGVNARVRYSLTDDGRRWVIIDPVSGMLTAAVSFDRETTRRVEFVVVATDGGATQRSASATVVVHIDDVDDEVAVFVRDVYAFEMPEDTPVGTSIGRVTAHDADSDVNAVFSLVAEGDVAAMAALSVDPSTGVVRTAGRLDRETRSQYELTVTTTNGGGRARVHIVVTDVNDNVPTVITPTVANDTVYVSNRAAVGFVVTTIRATDPDAGENGTLTYSVTDGDQDGEFVMDARTGALLVAGDLSAFHSAVFLLVITVADGGRPSRVTTATLNVVVNRSVPLSPQNGARRSALSGNGVVLVVSVVCATVVVVLALVMVLCCVRRRRAKWQSGGGGGGTTTRFPRAPDTLAPPGGGKSLDDDVSGSSASSAASDEPDDTKLATADDHYGIDDLKSAHEAGELAMMFNTDSAAYRNKVVSRDLLLGSNSRFLVILRIESF